MSSRTEASALSITGSSQESPTPPSAPGRCFSILHMKPLRLSDKWPLKVLLTVSKVLLAPKVKVARSCSILRSHGLYSPCNSPGQNAGVSSSSLLQGIFPTQGSNSGLPLCRWILYLLSHQGSPRILRWVSYPFSSISS